MIYKKLPKGVSEIVTDTLFENLALSYPSVIVNNHFPVLLAAGYSNEEIVSMGISFMYYYQELNKHWIEYELLKDATDKVEFRNLLRFGFKLLKRTPVKPVYDWSCRGCKKDFILSLQPYSKDSMNLFDGSLSYSCPYCRGRATSFIEVSEMWFTSGIQIMDLSLKRNMLVGL